MTNPSRRTSAGILIASTRSASPARQRPAPCTTFVSDDPIWVEGSLTWFPRYHHVPEQYIKDRIRDGLRVPAHVWMAGLAGLTTAVPPSESGTITAPTLIVWGGLDELLPLQDGHLLVAAIRGSRLILYEDTGHLVLWEQPERVATEIVAFVAGLSTSGQNSTPIS